jgi:pimeloyl-ACP methyl ester carboxylesterase
MSAGSLRHAELGEGPALVHLAAEAALGPAHALLGRHLRVVVLDTRQPGVTPASILAALAALGIERLSLLGSAAAARTALEVARAAPERVLDVVLESPTAAAAEADLAAVSAPTLVLCGTLDDDAPAAARRCAARIPNAHLTFVYAAGPAIAADRPAAFADVVADFLERHEAFVISRATTVIHP